MYLQILEKYTHTHVSFHESLYLICITLFYICKDHQKGMLFNLQACIFSFDYCKFDMSKNVINQFF